MRELSLLFARRVTSPACPFLIYTLKADFVLCPEGILPFTLKLLRMTYSHCLLICCYLFLSILFFLELSHQESMPFLRQLEVASVIFCFDGTLMDCNCISSLQLFALLVVGAFLLIH